MIYGAAGLAASVEERPRPRHIYASRDVLYTPPANKTDKDVADDVYRLLALPLTRLMPLFAIKRDEHNGLQLDFYDINGIHRVTSSSTNTVCASTRCATARARSSTICTPSR